MKLEKLREAHPEAEAVELWAEDEAWLGLKAVMRRVWAPVGKSPIARFKRGYEWTYLYGFRVAPKRGGVLADPAHGKRKAVVDAAGNAAIVGHGQSLPSRTSMRSIDPAHFNSRTYRTYSAVSVFGLLIPSVEKPRRAPF